MKKYLIPALVGTGLLALTLTIAAFDRPTTLNASVTPQNETFTNRQGSFGMMGGSTRTRGGMMGGNFQNTAISTDLTGTDYTADTLKTTLDVLLADEFKARAEYQAIVDAFGLVSPYTQLIQAETRHIESLERIYTAFGFAIPTDNGKDFVVLPASIEASYQVGISAETANIALYKNVLATTLPSSLQHIFTNLEKASENHLATFTAYQSGDTTSLVNGCQGRNSRR